MREKHVRVPNFFFFWQDKRSTWRICGFSQCMQSLPAVGQGGTEKLRFFIGVRVLNNWAFESFGMAVLKLSWTPNTAFGQEGWLFLYSRCQFRARAESMSDTPAPKRHPWKAPWVFMESQKEAGMERHILNLKELTKKRVSFCEIFFGVIYIPHWSDQLWSLPSKGTCICQTPSWGESFGPRKPQALGRCLFCAPQELWVMGCHSCGCQKALGMSKMVSTKKILMFFAFVSKNFLKTMEEFGLFRLEFSLKLNCFFPWTLMVGRWDFSLC